MAALLWLGIGLAAHAQTTVEYIHTDALGTPIAVTDANKVVIETTEYEPYGAQVAGPVKDGPGYTGHVQDVATGLTYMQQRYYDPLVGIFLSVDPVTAYSSPMGQFHRYRYANNNPFSFIDPDGRQSEDRDSRSICNTRKCDAVLDGSALGSVAGDGKWVGGGGRASPTAGATGSSAGGASGSWEAWEDRELASGRIESVCPECWVLPFLRAFRGGAAAEASVGQTLALQGPRQIQAAWGASVYRHGGLMQGIQHIMYRHGPNTGFSNVSKFSQGTKMAHISRYVDSALRYGSVTRNGPAAYYIDYNVGRVIGTNVAGAEASYIRVYVRDGIIQTAFPF